MSIMKKSILPIIALSSICYMFLPQALQAWDGELSVWSNELQDKYLMLPTKRHEIVDKEPPCNTQDYDVMEFGGIGDGVTDDTMAFRAAWSVACEQDNARMIVPKNRTFLVGPTNFNGPCGRKMSLKVEGTILAPPNPEWWSEVSPQTWLVFSQLDGLTLDGNGIIDGQGQQWWTQSCKINKTNPCHNAPSAITILRSNNTWVKDLIFRNSQQMHLVFDECIKVIASGLTITAPGKSPNTDGIHLHASSEVQIKDSVIGTGDDCISIQTDSFNTHINNVYCGPGHGISIGSLGKGGKFDNVSDIMVDKVVLNGTTNGVRIKTWQGGQGAANNIEFHNVRMINVANPIIIDQYYCDSEVPCHNQTSAVEVSEITYKNIIGTSSTPIAMKFACSDIVPCHHILLENINLVLYNKTFLPASAFCENAKGSTWGMVNPISCLSGQFETY